MYYEDGDQLIGCCDCDGDEHELTVVSVAKNECVCDDCGQSQALYED